VILITLDAFNYELFVDNIDMLPNMKRMQSESASFEHAFAIGPSTFFSFPGILASTYPYHFGVGVDRSTRTIDEILKEYGYNTAQVNEANALLTPFFGYGRGTDLQQHLLEFSHVKADRGLSETFLDGKPVRRSRRPKIPGHFAVALYRRASNRWIRRSARPVAQAVRFLRISLTQSTESYRERKKLHTEFRDAVSRFVQQQFETPQFLFIHTIVNHLPYYPPEDTRSFTEREIDYLNYRGLSGLVNKGICERLKSLYIESFRSTDALIGEIMDALRNNGHLDNSIVVITADHGEEFMEEGHFGHTDESNSDRLLHVPLMIRYPAMIGPKCIEPPVSTIDIVPTICDLVERNVPGTCCGMSLKPILAEKSSDSRIERQLWRRPLFSESWERSGVLDRSPGSRSARRFFTVRKGQHKLSVTWHERGKGPVKEDLGLVNWVAKEPLDTEANSQIVDELKGLLLEHLSAGETFAKRVRAQNEMQKVRRTLARMRSQSSRDSLG